MYINMILCHYHFADLKPLSTLMDVQVHLSSKQAPASATECTTMHNVPYHKAIGALNWAALATCPDIAFTVVTIVHFAANPRPIHWKAIKQIFHYLTGMCDLWLLYGKSRCTLKGYIDADGSMAEDRCAITGYAFLINSGTISWSSKCQETVSLSIIKSKYIMATSAKINFSYSILFHLTTSYSSYFGGKKGISRNKTSFFLLMN